MPLSQETDVASLAQARLLAQFKNKPLLTGRLTAICNQLQDLENAFWTLLTNRPFPYAVGDALTHWGYTVGEIRPAGLVDSTYRPMVVAKILENISTGRVEDVFSLVRALGATMALYSRPAPATMLLEYQGNLVATDAQLLDFLNTATEPIVFGVTEYTAQPFGFALDPDAYGFDAGELGRSMV